MIKILRGKVVAVMLRKKKVLFVREKRKRNFSFPGGKIEEGETVEEALKREAKEETNCKIRNPRFLLSFLSGMSQPMRHGNFVFIVEFEGDPKPGNEIVETRFFTYNEAKKRAGPSARFLLEELRKKGLV